MADEKTEENYKSDAKTTSSLMNDIIFEDLKSINIMIRDSPKAMNKQSIIPLWKAIDSWEHEVKRYVTWKYYQNKLDKINDELDDAFKDLLHDWTVEHYLRCVDLVIEKKGILIEAISPSLSQTNFFFKVG